MSVFFKNKMYLYEHFFARNGVVIVSLHKEKKAWDLNGEVWSLFITLCIVCMYFHVCLERTENIPSL